MSETPKVVIFVRGGLVQEVRGSVPVDYLIIDADCENDDEAILMRDWGDTDMYNCSIVNLTTRPEPQQVEHYFNQIPSA
jgi:hypothetical protein